MRNYFESYESLSKYNVVLGQLLYLVSWKLYFQVKVRLDNFVVAN